MNSSINDNSRSQHEITALRTISKNKSTGKSQHRKKSKGSCWPLVGEYTLEPSMIMECITQNRNTLICCRNGLLSTRPPKKRSHIYIYIYISRQKGPCPAFRHGLLGQQEPGSRFSTHPNGPVQPRGATAALLASTKQGENQHKLGCCQGTSMKLL